jgi:hypothetical protein
MKWFHFLFGWDGAVFIKKIFGWKDGDSISRLVGEIE